MQSWDSVLVVGHSYGAPLVIRLAAEHPKRIAGLVALGFGYPAKPPSQTRCYTTQVVCAAKQRAGGCKFAKLKSAPLLTCKGPICATAVACSRHLWW